MRKAVICFTRVPRAGQTKTRLMPALTPEQCEALHWAFLKDLSQVYSQVEADLLVVHTPDPNWELLKDVFPTAVGFYPQVGNNLWIKMDNGLRQALALQYDAVILTGTDLPGMTAAHLNSGFAALEQADLALGPTPDGGYYLIGTKKPCPEVFVLEGDGSVYEKTLAAAQKAGYTVSPALACRDVDTPQDLAALALPHHSHTGQYLKQEGWK